MQYSTYDSRTMVHKFEYPYLLKKYDKMIDKKASIQEQNYIVLTATKMNSIYARYLAFKFAEIEYEIDEIEIINELVFKMISSKCSYLVTLPDIPIPDAKIELI